MMGFNQAQWYEVDSLIRYLADSPRVAKLRFWPDGRVVRVEYEWVAPIGIQRRTERAYVDDYGVVERW